MQVGVQRTFRRLRVIALLFLALDTAAAFNPYGPGLHSFSGHRGPPISLPELLARRHRSACQVSMAEDCDTVIGEEAATLTASAPVQVNGALKIEKVNGAHKKIEKINGVQKKIEKVNGVQKKIEKINGVQKKIEKVNGAQKKKVGKVNGAQKKKVGKVKGAQKKKIGKVNGAHKPSDELAPELDAETADLWDGPQVLLPPVLPNIVTTWAHNVEPGEVSNLASIMSERGDQVEADVMRRSGLKIWLETFGLDGMNKMANILLDRGNFSDAEELLKAHLEIRLRTLGRHHLESLRSKNNLAKVMQIRGDIRGSTAMKQEAWDSVEGKLRDALDQKLRDLGKKHPDTLSIQNNLAKMLKLRGDMIGAKDLQREVLDVITKKLGTEHAGIPKSYLRKRAAYERMKEEGTLVEELDDEEKELRFLDDDETDNLMLSIIKAARWRERRVEMSEHLGREVTDAEFGRALGLKGGATELRRRMKRMDKDRQSLIAANKRLIASIAHKYDFGDGKVDDLIQIGTIGLIKEIEKYDPSRGYRFSAMCCIWIRQAMSGAITDLNQVKIPAASMSAVRKLRRAKASLEKEGILAPTEQELAKSMGITVRKLQSVERHAKLSTQSTEDTVEGKKKVGNTFTKGAGLSEDSKDESDSDNSDDTGCYQRICDMMDELLSPEEAGVLKLRYGFAGEGRLTWKEMEERLKMSQKQMKIAEFMGMKKLRNNTKVGELFFDYLYQGST